MTSSIQGAAAPPAARSAASPVGGVRTVPAPPASTIPDEIGDRSDPAMLPLYDFRGRLGPRTPPPAPQDGPRLDLVG
jgi:hypothetical protein